MKKRRDQLEGSRIRGEAREERAKQAIAGLEFFLSGPGFPGVAADDLPKRGEVCERADCAAPSSVRK
jgi:hypothetical protein